MKIGGFKPPIHRQAHRHPHNCRDFPVPRMCSPRPLTVSGSGRHELDQDSHDSRDLHERAVTRWLAKTSTDQQSERDEAAGRAVAYKVPIDWVGPVKLALKWATTLAAYENFWWTATPHHAARENTRGRQSLPAGERNQGEWARYQRRFKAQLSTFQTERLNISPAFRWDPVESTWTEHLQECRRCFEQSGQLPILNSSDRREFTLARWLNRQLHQLRDGRLPPSRAAALNSLLEDLRSSGAC